MVTLQQLIFKLSEFWASRGCLLQQPLDIEMGAGTMHPETFLRVLGPARELETAHRRLIHANLDKELKSARVLRQLR